MPAWRHRHAPHQVLQGALEGSAQVNLLEANTEFTEAIKRTTRLLSKGPLATEMRRFLSQLQVGSSRPAALKELATRVDTPEMTSLVTALLHVSEQGREETLGQEQAEDEEAAG